MPTLHVTPYEFRAIVLATTPRRFVPIFPPDVPGLIEVNEEFEFMEGLLMWFGVPDSEIAAAKTAWQFSRQPIHVERHVSAKLPRRWDP